MARTKLAEVTKGLKSLFVIHGILSLISGVLLLFVPFIWAQSMKWELLDAEPMRVIGAFTIALALKDLLGLMAKRWDEVRIIVIMEVAWTLLATIVFLRAVLMGLLPMTFWSMVILFGAFFVAWTYFYLKYR
jgi:hypothetical protein